LLFGGNEIWGVGDGDDDVCVGRWWEIVAPLYVDMERTMSMNTERNRHEKRKQREILSIDCDNAAITHQQEVEKFP
jgi:hypothetical protein